MNIQQNVSLRDYSTMKLGGKTAFLAHAATTQELIELVAWAESQGLPILIIGTGSNVVWRDEGFTGLVIVNNFLKFDDFAEDELNHYVTIGAGEPWETAVARTVALGLTGIEALSLIPGRTGATPVQNVGAYGQDISQTLVSLEAYDIQTKSLINIPAMDCGFGYRTSRFNGVDKARFIITNLTLHLTKANPQPPFYASLQKYFAEHSVTEFTPQTVRAAVIDIRSHKLPDPRVIANNGSFFANPIISQLKIETLQSSYPQIPHWETDTYGYVKVPAAWLIEQAGFKDFHDAETGMATWPSQPLVLVNESATSTSQLLAFKKKIVDAVQAKFGIILEQEPELLPIEQSS